MDKIISCIEHAPFPDDTGYRHWDERLQQGLCLNPEADDFDKRFFIKWVTLDRDYGYRATYVIGAQWVDTGEGRLPVTVVPKMPDIDYLRMFCSCLTDSSEAARPDRLYSIDWQAEPIRCPQLDSVLSPLLVVHYLSVLRPLLAKGLRKGYVERGDNLRKLKGRPDNRRNEKTNVLRGRLDRFQCRFQEFSEDIPENRLLKKALLFARAVVMRLPSQAATELAATVNTGLAALHGVSGDISAAECVTLKPHKLYREYTGAMRLARLVLHRYDHSLTQAEAPQDTVPPFWIDMSLLYEHYVYGMLRKAYPGDILYQVQGTTGFPDFLSRSERMILDTKYIPGLAAENPDTYIVRQLAGYARDRKILARLDVSDDETVPCVLIYPGLAPDTQTVSPFTAPLRDLCRQAAIPGLTHFYRLRVDLPVLAGATKTTPPKPLHP